MTFSNTYADARRQLTIAIPRAEIKRLQRQIVEIALDSKRVTWDYGSWIVPQRRRSEKFRGYTSRLSAWAYGLIAENLCDRMDDPEENFPICGLADFGELR